MQDRREHACADWRDWRNLFLQRRGRPLPDPFAVDPQLAAVPASVARSLAVFQLGESGGGTIIEQARQSGISTINDDYAEAMVLFVAEEHRHAELLACGVRMLKGELISDNWTAKLFVFGRRLIGLRLKVMVLLVAEVVGICYYHLLASRLPLSRLRTLLEEIVADELLHLDFHCAFLRRQTRSSWRRAVFRFAWRLLSCAAAAVVLIDHRRALSDMHISFVTVWQRWMACSCDAESLVCDVSLESVSPRSTTRFA
ncbi:MAG: hypothetical protein OEO82_02340 [Gammaproteobacteria bacterium]|nr:hypothetical protein [Gammaproteobacteria bacterium]